ncbi:nitrate reductase [bacterium AH-315-I18]|nr:nitrate reductase [bacterium AH-315-I18]
MKQSICPYCGVGCQIQVSLESDSITRIGADKTQRPNHGMLCAKGATLKSPGMWDTADRLTTPLIRTSRNKPLQPVTWDEAADFLGQRLTTMRQEHGRDSLAYYGSGQLDTEASYLFTKFFKGSLGTNHMDTNSRLCMSSAVAGYVQTFGSDGPPTCYDDISHADVFLIIGSNMAITHPVLYKLIHKRRIKNPHVRIITVDPRKTQTAKGADIHVPIKPGSDVAFCQLIAKRLLKINRLDESFIRRSTEGFDEYQTQLRWLDERALLEACDIHPARIDEVVYALSDDVRLLSFYCQGTNQSIRGVDKNVALIQLHMQLGEIGKPGAGPFSLTGQPNAMGGREVGYLSHQLPGYRLVTNSDHRKAVEQSWQLPPNSIQPQPGLPAVALFEALVQKQIKGLWIAGTNPVVSMPDSNRVIKALKMAELVIAQDCYRQTETNAFADVLLPAAQWGEKTGTMTSSERLVSRSEKMFDPPKLAKPDWWIVARVARAMGFKGFDYETSDDVWDEFRQLTAGTVCDQAGMTTKRLKRGPLQWPCPWARHSGTARLYTNGKFNTPSHRARFTTVYMRDPAQKISEQFPFVLTTGRVANHWHTRTRTGKIPQLNDRDPAPYLEMHPLDAQQLGFESDQMIRIVSQHGEARAALRVTDTIRRRLVFMAFHWGQLFDTYSNINAAVGSEVDAVSKQPELKFCAVRLEPVVTVSPFVQIRTQALEVLV